MKLFACPCSRASTEPLLSAGTRGWGSFPSNGRMGVAVTMIVTWFAMSGGLFSKPFPLPFGFLVSPLFHLYLNWTVRDVFQSSSCFIPHVAVTMIFLKPHMWHLSSSLPSSLKEKLRLPWLTNSISHYKFIPLPIICSSYSIKAHHAILFFQVFVMFSPSLSARKILVNV